jgi:hypothetical protein
MMRNYDFNKGVLARGHGKEEKNAAEMQRYGMVDEEETVAFSFETESSPLRTAEMGNHGR